MAASLTCLAIVHITYCTIHLQCSFCEPIFLVLNGNYSTTRHCSYSSFFFFSVFHLFFLFLLYFFLIKVPMRAQCFGTVHLVCLHCASTARQQFFFFCAFCFFVFSFLFIYNAFGLVNRHIQSLNFFFV